MGYDVEWDEQGYEVHTGALDEGGQVIVADSPCGVLSALEGSTSVTENSRGLIDRVTADCGTWRQSHPLPAPHPITPDITPSSAEPVETAPPVDGDSPELQGAPMVASTVQVSSHKAHPSFNTRTPTNSHFDQFAPVSAEVLATWVAPEGAPSAEVDDLAERIRRNQPMPRESDPTFSRPQALRPTVDADPVDLFTGALTMSVTDLVIPTAALPIRMQRSFRSGRPYYGPFGFGWDHNWNVYLRPLLDGAMALWSGNLREMTFTANGNGWNPPAESAMNLRRGPEASETYHVEHPGGVVHVFTRPAGWPDPERIPLVSVTDRHGNHIELAHDQLGRLASVLDQEDRGLFFRYGTCGLLEGIADHTGTRTVEYGHDPGIEHLVCVRLPATAQFPRGPTTGYEYEQRFDHPAMRHNIVRVRDAEERTYLETDYAGPEAEWAFNTVTRQLVGGDEFQFRYEQLQYVPENETYLPVPASRTMVLPPDGSLHTHTFNYRGDLLEHRFRLIADGSFRVVYRSFEYDRSGNCTAITEPDGLRHRMIFDAENPNPCDRRNLLRVEVGTALPGLVPSRTLQVNHYEPRFQLVTHSTTESGAMKRWFYDLDGPHPASSGRLERVEQPGITRSDGTVDLSVTQLEHDARGRLDSVTAPDGGRTTFDYASAGPDEARLVRMVQDADSTGLETAFEYDAAGHPLRIIGPGGRVATIRCNALGQAENVIPPSSDGTGSSYRTWFGDAGLPVRTERPRGNTAEPAIADEFITAELNRDVLGRVVSVRQAANSDQPRVWTQRVDHLGRSVQETDPVGNITRRTFDERGLQLSETQAVGRPEQRTSHAVYDLRGRPIRLIGPTGSVTTLDYDLWGRLATLHLPAGALRRYRWGVEDRLLEVTEEAAPSAGATARVLTRSTWDFDERGRVSAHVLWAFDENPASAQPVTTRYRYDGGDRVTGVELPHGRILTFEHDALGRLASAADGVGTEYDAAYNPFGDLQTMTVTKDFPGAQRQITWTFEYNARGLPSAVVAPDARTEFEYDAAGRMTRRREPGGVVVEFAWDAWGQLRETVLDPSGLGLHTHWDYKPDGLLARLVDPEGARTSWTYDALDRVHETLLPGGAEWHTTYDPAGAWIENVSPAGHRVRHYLDAAGRVDRRETAAAAGARTVPTQQYSYDPLGRLIQASQPGDTVQRHYDSLHRLIAETTDQGSVHLTYDDTAGTSILRYPDGRSERTTYDLAGRSTHVQLLTAGGLGGTPGEVLASMSHMRLPMQLALPNGVVSEFRYDDLDRLVSVRHLRHATVFERWDARYDQRGRRALTRISTEPKISSLHTFDAKDRLVEVRRGFDPGPMADPWTSQDHAAALATATTASALATEHEVYGLNTADARVSVTRSRVDSPPVMELLTSDSEHRILSVNGLPLTYHGDGQRSRDHRWVYDVDALGRVVEIRDSTTGAVRARYSYDALSRVIGGIDSEGSFTRTWWDGQPLEERRGAPGGLRQFTPHPLRGLPLCITDQHGRHFLHVDGARSSMCATNTFGAVVERYQYGTFGEPLIVTGDSHAPLAEPHVAARWRGMTLDQTLGLYLSPSRLYDPHLGVFLAPDPLLYADSPSTSVFAGHNPVDFADPSGLAKSPLGDDAAPSPPHDQAATAPDWTTHTEWSFPPPAQGLLQPITSADTGIRGVNIVANKVLLPWVNFMAFWTNVPLATLMGVDDAIKHSPLAVEYDAFQHMDPLFPAMGLTLEGVPATMGALDVLGRGAAGGAVDAAKAPVFLALGAGGGAVLPLRSAAARAVHATEQGVVDVGRGQLGFSSYSTAPLVSKSLGMAGAEMEAMHMFPQTIGKVLPASHGYSPHRALTTLAPRALHQAWDRTWVPVWNAAVRNGTPMTANDVYRMLITALDHPLPDPVTGQQLMFSPEVRGTIVFAIESEMKALGLTGSTVILR